MDERILIEARNRTLAVEDGVVAEPNGRYDIVLRFPDADLRPGLINAHDHLHRNHYGRLGTPPYVDAYAWADDVRDAHWQGIAAERAMPRRRALLVGAWKNLFCGVTTVVHHDRWELAFVGGFPLRVVRIPCPDSLGMAPDFSALVPGRPFCLHVAEGTGPRAACEVDQLAVMGLLGPDLVAVHGVGIEDEGIARFRASGAALVWCPSSNAFLLGRTARAELLAEGLDVLLGSDSLLTGAGDLLDELRAARATGLLRDERLEEAVGAVAARRLGIAVPELRPGAPADLVVLSRPLLEAGAEDVQLVMVAGIPRVVAPDLGIGTRARHARLATVDGVTRWIDELPRKGGESMNHFRSFADQPHEVQLQAPGD